LRHSFITGKTPLIQELNAKHTNLLGNGEEERKHKKNLTAIPEKEEPPDHKMRQDLIEEEDDNKQMLSLTKLENEMVISVVESDDKININLKKYEDDKNSIIFFFDKRLKHIYFQKGTHSFLI